MILIFKYFRRTLLSLVGIIVITVGNSQNLFPTDSVLQFNSRVGIIFQDSKDHYWFVAQNEGLCRYDGKQFTYFTKEQGLVSIRGIHEHTNGDIWFGIEDGVMVFNGETFTIVYPAKESLPISESFQYSDSNYETKWAEELACFWFSAADKNGVYRFDGKKLTYLTLPVPEQHISYNNAKYPDFTNTNGYLPEHGFDIYAVYGIYKDNNGVLWFGTAGGGLFKYDGKSISCINEKEEKGVVRAIHQDKNGMIWFGNNAKGVLQYDGKSLNNFSISKGVFKNGLVGALSIAEDEEDNLWIGQFDTGLWYYNAIADQAGKNPFTQYTHRDGLESNYISTLYIDKKGKLWVGTGIGGVFVYNGEGFDQVK